MGWKSPGCRAHEPFDRRLSCVIPDFASLIRATKLGFVWQKCIRQSSSRPTPAHAGGEPGPMNTGPRSWVSAFAGTTGEREIIARPDRKERSDDTAKDVAHPTPLHRR